MVLRARSDWQRFLKDRTDVRAGVGLAHAGRSLRAQA